MGPRVRPVLLVVIMLLSGAAAAAAQGGSITGNVSDAESGRPLRNARVRAVGAAGLAAEVFTAPNGRFRLSVLPEGTYTVTVALVGYEPRRVSRVHVGSGEPAVTSVALRPLAEALNPVVVSATRSREKVLDAPASISVVEARVIEERPTITPVDHLRGIPGVDIASTGLMQSNVVTRGFNNVFSGQLLTLSDNRYAFVPSLRLNAPWLMPSTNEDIERIEVLLGPAAALYGPNSATGVMHVITRSPFQWQGTTLSMGGGSRAANPTGGSGELWRGAIRHAGTVGTKFGYKVTGQYTTGDDWQELDSAEVSARREALAAGAREDALLIGRRDFTAERWSAEARTDFRPDANTDVILSVGRTHAGSAIELTGLGAAQARDWNYDYYQARIRHRRLFAQAFVNTSDAGGTYLLRTGQPVVDKSRMFVGQLQHGFDVGGRQRFIYGLDAQRTDPRTEGTINGRNEEDDTIDEIGGYIHSVTRLSPRVDVIAAARVDNHSRLADPVFSPRAAIVFKPSETHSLRMTYNRAFNTPSTNNLFLDIVAGRLSPLPFDVRTIGVPESGLTFRRDCGGLCMRSPFASNPTLALPTDATLLWPAIVEIVRTQRGIDLSGIPAPTAVDVRSVLRVLDIMDRSFNTVAPADIRDIAPLREQSTNTVELGYKGVLGGRVRLAADVYWEQKHNFIGPLLVETPNVFLEAGRVGEPGTLATYLAQFLPLEQAQVLAIGIGGISGSALAPGIPVGTVAPESGLTGGPDLVVTYRNFGTLDRWGADLAAEALLSDRVTLSATYSWTNKDLFPRSELGGFSDIALNAPENKGSLGLRYQNERTGLSGELRGRYVAGFPMNSGVYIGDVDEYTLADVVVAYRVPRVEGVILSLSAQNVFNDRHREFVGAPVLGRLVMAQAQYTF